MSRAASLSPFAAALCALAGACAAPPGSFEFAPMENGQPVAGSPTELYTRVARGALACWFGAGGELKRDYIYHADAEPASRGGASQIVVRAKEALGPSPKGVRAFRVAIKPKGLSAEMEITNYKLPEALGLELEGDVRRWAAGDVGCRDVTRGADWSPRDPAEAAPVAPPARKAKAAGQRKL